MNLGLDNFLSTSDQELIGLGSRAIDSKQVLECIKVRTNKRLNLSHRIKSMLMIEVDARVSGNGSNLWQCKTSRANHGRNQHEIALNAGTPVRKVVYHLADLCKN